MEHKELCSWFNGGECDCKDEFAQWLDEVSEAATQEWLDLVPSQYPTDMPEYLFGYAAGVHFTFDKVQSIYQKREGGEL